MKKQGEKNSMWGRLHRTGLNSRMSHRRKDAIQRVKDFSFKDKKQAWTRLARENTEH